jgi:hypothetical protein
MDVDVYLHSRAILPPGKAWTRDSVQYSRSGLKKNLLPVPEIKLKLLGHPTYSLVTVLAELSRRHWSWVK